MPSPQRYLAEVRDGWAYCTLCQRWWTEEHQRSAMHVRRSADPVGFGWRPPHPPGGFVQLIHAAYNSLPEATDNSPAAETASADASPQAVNSPEEAENSELAEPGEPAQQPTCVACMTNLACMANVPCGHLLLFAVCAPRQIGERCYVCRNSCQWILHVYIGNPIERKK